VSFSFDDQAGGFDARAGLSPQISAQIAEAVLQYGDCREQDQVVEIGAGTGEIGQYLCRPGLRYIGIDNSEPMLAEFRLRLQDSARAHLVCADANAPWPVEEASTRLIFGSRVFHLLESDHVLNEMQRAGLAAGVTLVIGRVKRPKESPKAMMREKMRSLLAEYGQVPRQTEQRRRLLLERAAERGGSVLGQIEAASWQAEHRPIQSIVGWEGKDSMGGIVPPAAVKKKILAQLREWGSQAFGDLEAPVRTQESYLLEGIRCLKGGKNKE